MRHLTLSLVAVLTLAVAAPAHAGDQYEGKIDSLTLKYFIQAALKARGTSNGPLEQNVKFASGTVGIYDASGKMAVKSVELKPTQDTRGENSHIYFSDLFSSPQGTVKVLKANTGGAAFDAQITLVRVKTKYRDEDFALIDTVGKHFPGGGPKDGGLTFTGRPKADYDAVNKSKVTDDNFMFVITLSPEVVSSAGALTHSPAMAQILIKAP